MKQRSSTKRRSKPHAIAPRLLSWYEQHRRDLPWRPPPGGSGGVDPYAVLVSEVMLQQTQVATVTPYFLRFMQAFATIGQLAAAPQQQVLRLWQGLGYYSRARNLQAAAKMIVAEFGGRIPSSVQDLMGLPGVGRYTAGAVASIAFGRRAPSSTATSPAYFADWIKSVPIPASRARARSSGGAPSRFFPHRRLANSIPR